MFKRFTVGFAAGYVFGARAGQKRYEQITALAGRAMELPVVAQVADSGRIMAAEGGRRFMDSFKDAAGLSPLGGSESDEDDDEGEDGRSWRDRLHVWGGGRTQEADYEDDSYDDYADGDEAGVDDYQDDGGGAVADDVQDEYDDDLQNEYDEEPEEFEDEELEDFDEADDSDLEPAADEAEPGEDDEPAPRGGRGGRATASRGSRQSRPSRSKNGAGRPKLSAVAAAARDRGRVG